MKKKTFIVQLLDSKKPNKDSFTQIEDANFYSNDTDASLVFIPHEYNFEFQTAKVVMFNNSDQSLVERDMVVTTEDGRKVASFELPEEIILRWGEWVAQPVFINSGEIYSGSIVPFSVFRYLLHGRPAKLEEIVEITDFLQQSQTLVDGMVQSESQRVLNEQARQNAEAIRVQAENERSGWYTTAKPQVAEAITKADRSEVSSSQALTNSQNALSVANGIDAKATNALSLAESANTISQGVRDEFDQIVADSGDNVEVTQARVNVSGVAKPTLKQRLDDDYNEVIGQLADIPALLENLSDYKIVGDDTKHAGNVPSDFEQSAITITKIHSDLNNTAEFPVTNGQLITLVPGFENGADYGVQTVLSTSGQVHIRGWRSTGTPGWFPFRRIGAPPYVTVTTDDVIIVPANGITDFVLNVPLSLGIFAPFVARPTSSMGYGVSYTVTRMSASSIKIMLANHTPIEANLNKMTWLVKVLE